MQVNLYAIFRLHAGVKTFDLDLPPGTSVYQAVLRIASLYPRLRKDWLDENDRLNAYVLVFVDGSEVGSLPQGLDTPLQPENVLDFFPPLAGGEEVNHEVTKNTKKIRWLKRKRGKREVFSTNQDKKAPPEFRKGKHKSEANEICV